jgi:ferredoxin
VDARIAQKVTRMPGLTVTVMEDRCEGCGRCTSVCFVDAISIGPGDRAVIGDDCRGCGRCAAQCPNQAIELRLVDPAGVERAIARIEQVVDL